MKYMAMMNVFFALTLLTTGLTCLVADAAKRGPVINAHSNDIMPNATIYPIYFGQWNATRIKKIQKFLKDLGGSNWFRTDKLNYDLRSLTLGQSVVISSNETRLDQYYWTGSTVSDKSETEFAQSSTQVMDVINRAMRTAQLPTNSSGIYLFLPSSGVDVYKGTKFLTWSIFCAFHGYFHRDAGQGQLQSIKYAVVPDLAKCSSNWAIRTPALGGDHGLEAITTNAYHELVETMTNPTGGGYFVDSGPYQNEENAELCNLDFGTVCPDETGAYYNTLIRGVKYMLQTNYNPKSRKCGNLGALTPQPGQNCTMIRPGFYTKSSNHHKMT